METKSVQLIVEGFEVQVVKMGVYGEFTPFLVVDPDSNGDVVERGIVQIASTEGEAVVFEPILLEHGV